jgi:hypothetical protein
MRNTAARSVATFLAGLAYLFLAGCEDSATDLPEMVDSGSWYRSGFRWPHDGNPYESEHFIVYSDAASLEARQKVAEIGEELLVSLKEDFQISGDTLFVWPTGQSRIHIYTYRDHYEQGWGGWGYYGGLLIYSLDHPIRDTELGNYTRVLKHELMHVIEGLVKGSDNPNLVDVWLTEGIAEYVAGGTQSISSVSTLAQLEELVATFGELNPIAMHQYAYPDIPGVGAYYYVMFELAVKYLLDPAGGGQAKPSIRDIYIDARNGVPFAPSFEANLGHNLDDFEDWFFELVRGFLN